MGEGEGKGVGVGLVCGQGSEDGQEQVKTKTPNPFSSSPTTTATAEAAPTPLPFKRIRTAKDRLLGRMIDSTADEQVKPNLNPLAPNPWQVEHGYELCSDEIWRPKEDRDKAGFTVKGEDHIWGKESK